MIERTVLHHHHDDVSDKYQSSTFPVAKWCRQGTTFVRELCDLIGMVRAKSQFSLRNAKRRFEEYLAVIDSVNKSEHERRT